MAGLSTNRILIVSLSAYEYGHYVVGEGLIGYSAAGDMVWAIQRDQSLHVQTSSFTYL